ncbi:hypothetical protein GIB67_032344 [Kingdonia uniflora]|uniref:Uncharacterized protein n=1 Tax=Kingdonia uniflora TaxID=39325 RepID=A0A7J7MXG7_9MAGN|nr:hypothetical protein GIB67_032344 [Kingdonia uniflora]
MILVLIRLSPFLPVIGSAVLWLDLLGLLLCSLSSLYNFNWDFSANMPSNRTSKVTNSEREVTARKPESKNFGMFSHRFADSTVVMASIIVTNVVPKQKGLAETGVADEDFMDIASAKFNRRSVRTVKTESFTQESLLFAKPWNTDDQYDDVDYGKPAVPRDFGVQCEALVEKFQVSPLICGLSGVIWMRYVAASRVFDKDWADDSIAESER